MSGSPMSGIHDGVFIPLINAVCIYALFKVISYSRIMSESDLSFGYAFSVTDKLIEVINGIIDHKGRCPCKVAVRPCVGDNMHGNSGTYVSLSLCQFYRSFYKCAVRSAYKTVLVHITPCSAGFCGIKIIWQKVKRGPYLRNIPQSYDVNSCVKHFMLKHRSCRALWPLNGRQE